MRPNNEGNGARSGIPAISIPDRALQISFAHLECNDDRYSLEHCNAEYWSLLAQELKRYARFTVSDFEVCEHADARHPIDPKEDGVDTAALSKIAEELEYPVVWQFGIAERWRGLRVVGILLEPVFYIVHLDPNHQTYTVKAARGW
jgi:hypothetical protein